MELECRFIRHCVMSKKALPKSEEVQVGEDHIYAVEEGSKSSYTKRIFQAVKTYAAESDGALCTTYVFETRMANVKMPDEHLQKFMKIWNDIQESEYDENDLPAIIAELKQNRAMHMTRQCVTEGESVFINQGMTPWLDHQALFHDKIRAELSTVKSINKRFNYADSEKIFDEFYGDRRDNPEKYRGIPTGIAEIDEAWGGMQAGQLYTIIGPTGGGKSVFLLNFAHHAWGLGKNILYLSVELQDHQCLFRHMSLALRVPHYKFEKIRLSKDEEEMCLSMLRKQRESENTAYFEYAVAIGDPTPEYIDSVIRELVAAGKPAPDLIVADYIGEMTTRALMSSNKEVKSWEKAEKALDGLWELGMRRGIAVLTASQFSQDGLKDRKKSLNEGKESIYDTSVGGGSSKLSYRSHSMITIDPDWETKRTTIQCPKGRSGKFDRIVVQMVPEFNEIRQLTVEDQVAWAELKGYKVSPRQSAESSDPLTSNRLEKSVVSSGGGGSWATDEPYSKTDVTELDMSDWEVPL